MRIPNPTVASTSRAGAPRQGTSPRADADGCDAERAQHHRERQAAEQVAADTEADQPGSREHGDGTGHRQGPQGTDAPEGQPVMVRRVRRGRMP